MSDEADELKEAAERAKEVRELAPVSLTMAILAVLVATVTLLGHRAHTEEMLLQTQATDQWSYYQAKNMRRNNLEALDDVLTALENTKEERAGRGSQAFSRGDRQVSRPAEGHSERGQRVRGRGATGQPTAPIASILAKFSWRSRWSSRRYTAHGEARVLVFRICPGSHRHRLRRQRLAAALRRFSRNI